MSTKRVDQNRSTQLAPTLDMLFDRNIMGQYDGWGFNLKSGEMDYFFYYLTERQANMALNKVLKYPQYKHSHIYYSIVDCKGKWNLCVTEKLKQNI